MKVKNKQYKITDFTDGFKNWFSELASYTEGSHILQNKPIEDIIVLYKRCTGKKALK